MHLHRIVFCFLYQLLDGDEEDEESSDEEVDEEMETEIAVSLAFDDVEETIEMPQAPGRFFLSFSFAVFFVWMGGSNCCCVCVFEPVFSFLVLQRMCLCQKSNPSKALIWISRTPAKTNANDV